MAKTESVNELMASGRTIFFTLRLIFGKLRVQLPDKLHDALGLRLVIHPQVRGDGQPGADQPSQTPIFLIGHLISSTAPRPPFSGMNST